MKYETDGEYLNNVVTSRSNTVDVTLAEHAHERRSVSFQDPFLEELELATIGHDDALLFVLLRQVHIHLCNRLDSLQRHVRQHVGFDAAQEDVILHFVDVNLIITAHLA